jgi:hypothetical protein
MLVCARQTMSTRSRLTILGRVCVGSDNVNYRQVGSILHIKVHDMVITLAGVLVRQLRVPVRLLVTRESRSLHHLECVYILGRGIRGRSTEHASKLFAILERQGRVGALDIDVDVSEWIHRCTCDGIFGSQSYGAVCE